MFTDCNEGMSLPLEISKKIALICIDEMAPEPFMYGDKIKTEIEKL